jgi:epoxyqueuosine reductase
VQNLQEEWGAFQAALFVDSAPVLDRAWARKCGLGWIGKNSMLINKSRGSDFFIANLFLDIELQADDAIRDYCGSCTRCIDACPTDAILPNRTLASERCISYLTIEYRGERIDTHYKDKMEDWVFGCDICQDVCPWNRFAEPTGEKEFFPSLDLLNMSREAWKEIDRERFNELFRKSAVKRTKYTGLKRNLDFVMKGTQKLPQ